LTLPRSNFIISLFAPTFLASSRAKSLLATQALAAERRGEQDDEDITAGDII
jgi:hypothetical protein